MPGDHPLERTMQHVLQPRAILQTPSAAPTGATAASPAGRFAQTEHDAADLVLEALEFARRINDRLHHEDGHGSSDLHVATGMPATPAA